MGLNTFLKSLFGDKSTRDMKLIQPVVEKIKAAYPEIKALDNDALRARTKEIQRYVQDSAAEQKKQIENTMERLQYKISKYENAIKTGELTWDK